MSESESVQTEFSYKVKLAIAALATIPPTEALKFNVSERAEGSIVWPKNSGAVEVITAMGGYPMGWGSPLGKTLRAFIEAVKTHGYASQTVDISPRDVPPVSELTILNPSARHEAGIVPLMQPGLADALQGVQQRRDVYAAFERGLR